jgi:hypothetical protein
MWVVVVCVCKWIKHVVGKTSAEYSQRGVKMILDVLVRTYNMTMAIIR